MSAVDHVYFATRAVEQARDALQEEGLSDPGATCREELIAVSQLAMSISKLMAATSEMSDVLMNVTLALSEKASSSEEMSSSKSERTVQKLQS